MMNRESREPREPRETTEKFGRSRRKVCRFCTEKELKIDYRNPELLRHFVTERGKIVPRRITNLCAKCQREMAVAVRRARALALLPFANVNA